MKKAPLVTRSVVVINRQAPRKQGIHQDSGEEIIYIVAGEGEAKVGDERAGVRTGDLAVIPAMVSHGVVNTGDEPLKSSGSSARERSPRSSRRLSSRSERRR